MNPATLSNRTTAKTRALPVAKPRCSTCTHFSSVARDGGRCHRYPPTVRLPFDAISVFPLVQDEDYCGEWKHKDPARNGVS